MTFVAGELVHPGKHHVDTLPVATGTITQGNFMTSSAGNAVALAASTDTKHGAFVALETAVFASGDTEIQYAGPGSDVTVVMGGAVQPGGYVKIAASNKAVTATGSAVAGGDLAKGWIIGRYLRHPGEDKATPAANNDLGIIKLGGAI